MSELQTATELPRWFTKPEPLTGDRQPCLFRVPLTELLPRLRVSPDDLNRWHKKGWLSFDSSVPLIVDQFDDPAEWEIIFVRDVVRSGLSDSQIEWLLSQCPKPFTFYPRLVSFSFQHGWVESVPPVDQDDPEDVLSELLLKWMDEGDVDSLTDLREKISEYLDNLVEEEPTS